MRAEERALAAERLRQIADGVGLDVSDEGLDRMIGLLESTVDGVRKAGQDLELDEQEPAFTTEIEGDAP